MTIRPTTVELHKTKASFDTTHPVPKDAFFIGRVNGEPRWNANSSSRITSPPRQQQRWMSNVVRLFIAQVLRQERACWDYPAQVHGRQVRTSRRKKKSGSVLFR